MSRIEKFRIGSRDLMSIPIPIFESARHSYTENCAVSRFVTTSLSYDSRPTLMPFGLGKSRCLLSPCFGSGTVILAQIPPPSLIVATLWRSSFKLAVFNPALQKMAYLNSYSTSQWDSIQESSWTNQGYGWENSAMSIGGSPESTSVSRPQSHLSEGTSAKTMKSSTAGSPLKGHWEPYPASTRAYRNATSTSMDSTYFAPHSESSSTSYILATTDDSYYYNGGMASYDMSPMPPSSLSSQNHQTQDYDPQYELQEPQSPDSSRGKSSSNPSSKIVSSPIHPTPNFVNSELGDRSADNGYRNANCKTASPNAHSANDE